MKILSLVLLLAALPEGAARTPASDRWKLDFKASLTEQDGRWLVSIDGVTDLPPQTVLYARVYTIDVIRDPVRGPWEDDGEPMVSKEDVRQPSYHRFAAGNGRIHETVYSFSRKPYSIRYRAKVTYFPKEQPPAVSLKVGDDEFERAADLRVGTDADLEQELRERIGQMGRDLQVLEKYGGDVRESAGKPSREWGPAMHDRIGELAVKNLERFDWWAVWPERQGRMRVDGLCDLLDRIISELADPLQDLPAHHARMKALFKGFDEYLEDAYEVLCIDAPIDPRRLRPLIASYEAALAPLRSEAQRSDSEVFRRARRDGLRALLELPVLLTHRRRAYALVNQVGARFFQVSELIEARAPRGEVEEALREHDAAVAGFRLLAGLADPSAQPR